MVKDQITWQLDFGSVYVTNCKHKKIVVAGQPTHTITVINKTTHAILTTV